MSKFLKVGHFYTDNTTKIIYRFLGIRVINDSNVYVFESLSEFQVVPEMLCTEVDLKEKFTYSEMN